MESPKKLGKLLISVQSLEVFEKCLVSPNYGTSTANPSLVLGVFLAIVAVVILSLSVERVSFTAGVCAGCHTDANLLQRMGDKVMDIKVS